MRGVMRIAGVLAVVASLAGCAGTDFVRPTSDTFKLGQTTYAQVVQKMGEPRKTGEVIKNEKNVKNIIYAYAATGGQPLEPGVIPARAIGFYFYNDVLVGQEFLSSFMADNSNFDETKVPLVKKGQTTRAEVTQMFGPPTATYIAPMVKQTAGEAVGYNYHTTRGGVFGGFKFFSKALNVSFDDKGVVSDVDYKLSESK